MRYKIIAKVQVSYEIEFESYLPENYDKDTVEIEAEQEMNRRLRESDYDYDLKILDYQVKKI